MCRDEYEDVFSYSLKHRHLYKYFADFVTEQIAGVEHTL